MRWALAWARTSWQVHHPSRPRQSLSCAIERLQAILDAAVITAEPDSDGLYVSEGTVMPLWAHVGDLP